MSFIIILFLVLLIIWMIKECRELHQFNYEGQIKELQSANKIVIGEKIKDKNPLLVHNVIVPSITIQEILQQNPGYIIKDSDKMILLDTFKDKDMSVYKSPSLFQELGYAQDLLKLSIPFETYMNCHKNGFMSFYKGYHTIAKERATHNLNLLSVVSGSSIVYLINPKHGEEIDGLDNNTLKKWSHKVVLKPGSILSVPSEWYYFYECKGEVIMYNYESDIYGTYLYNLLR